MKTFGILPSVWDVASYAGRRVAVVNVPVTYPVHAINGVMVSGMMTPVDTGEALNAKSSFGQTEVPRGWVPAGDIKSDSPVATRSRFLRDICGTSAPH